MEIKRIYQTAVEYGKRLGTAEAEKVEEFQTLGMTPAQLYDRSKGIDVRSFDEMHLIGSPIPFTLDALVWAIETRKLKE